MLSQLGEFFADKVRKWLPDSFSFAIILTFLSMVMAIFITKTPPVDLLEAWYKGFWRFLKFSMQMSLIVVLGYAVGNSPLLVKFFNRLGRKIKSPLAVYVTILIIGGVTAYIYWGFTVAVAVLAMEMARRVKGVDYRFLGACVYSSFIFTVFGPSITAPLIMNTPKNEFIQLGLVDRTFPPSETIFSSFSLTTLVATVVVVLATMLLMYPRKIDPGWDIAERIENGELAYKHNPIKSTPDKMIWSPAELIDRSPALTAFICIFGVSYIIYYFSTSGSAGINLDSLNFTFFIVGLAFWGRPSLFAQAIAEGTKGVASIIIQFPFYAGIMGIFIFTGLSKEVAVWIMSFANQDTFPWFAFIAASIANMFVPSAGGEWMVIGPTLLETAKTIGYPVGKLIMAYSFGDMVTNLIQPFWTLIFIPVLSKMVNIRARDIMGYTAVLFAVWFVTISVIIFSSI